jgi:hypothetical protein
MKDVAIDEMTRKRDYADMAIHLSVCEGRGVLSRAEVLDIVFQALVSYDKVHAFKSNPLFPESEE